MKTYLKITKLPKDTRFSYKNEYGICDEFYNVAVYARQYKDHNIFFSVPNISLECFFKALNLVKYKVNQKINSGAYTIFPNIGLDQVFFLYGDDGTMKKQTTAIRSDYNASDFCEGKNIKPEEIYFFRVDNEILTISYEDDLIAISSKYDIRDEIALFLDEIIPKEFEERKTSGAIRRFFEHKDTMVLAL